MCSYPYPASSSTKKFEKAYQLHSYFLLQAVTTKYNSIKDQKLQKLMDTYRIGLIDTYKIP